MMQNVRFQEKRYGNWLKSSLSLVYLKEALAVFTDEQMRNLHSSIKTRLLQQGCLPIPPGCLCKKCLTQNIRKQNNRPPCLKLSPPCRLKLCDKWLDMILAQHDHLPCPNVSWDNTNLQLWPVAHWEVAKVFQPYGCVDHQSSGDADAAALLTLMMNCTHFHQFVQRQPILQEIKDVRNKTMHTNDMLLEDADMLTDITKILDLLTDPKHLGQLVPCQEAVIKIEQLRDNKIDLSLNRELEIKALMQRTTAIETGIQTIKWKHRVLSESVKVLKDENESRKAESDELKQNIEQLEELKTNIEKMQKEIKTFQDFITTMGTEFDQLRNQLQTHKTDLLTILQTQQNQIHQLKIELGQIKQKNAEHDQRISTLEREQNKPRKKQCQEDECTDEIDIIKRKRTDLKRKLIQIYEARHLTTELNALIPDVVVKIEETYVQPHMQIERVNKRDNDVNKQDIKSYKDIFQKNLHDTGMCENIYISGEAGSGKSSYCKNMISTWCDVHSSTKQEKTKAHGKDLETGYMKFSSFVYQWLCFNRNISMQPENQTANTDQNIDEKDLGMKEFDFLFYIPLRECTSEEHVEEMIKLTLPKKYHDIISELLDDTDEQCLIILDGLDEWTSPHDHTTHSFINKGLPNREVWSKCSILTTTRPWKLAHLGLKSSEIDRKVNILGIADNSSRQLINKVVKLLNTEYGREKSADEFVDLLQKKKLKGMMKVPVILKQLICLWHDGKSIGESQCEIYSGMMELLFERADSRLDNVEDNNPIKDETSSKGKLPQCFSKTKKCQLIITLLLSVSKLAFFTIFNKSESSLLVFEKSTAIEYGVSRTEMEICLKAGLLSESRHNDMCTEETVKVTFFHKTFQEFLAALYIAVSVDSTEDQVDHITCTCDSVFRILEMSKVFEFVAGMSPTTVSIISKHISNVASSDERIQKYRQNDGDDTNVLNIQKVIQDCFHECELNGNQGIPLHLQDVTLSSRKGMFNYYQNPIAEYLKNIINIKSLSMRFKYYHPDVTSVQLDELQMFSFSGEGEKEDAVDLHLDILKFIQNSGSLLCTLSLDRIRMTNLTTEQFSNMLNNLPCLLSIQFKCVTFTNDQYKSLVKFLSQRTQMRQIKLVKNNTTSSSEDSIRDYDGLEQDRFQSPQTQTVSSGDCDCDIKDDAETYSGCRIRKNRGKWYILDLSNHDQLETMCIDGWASHTCIPRINSLNLKTCETKCESAVVSIKGALKLKKLTLNKNCTPQIVIQTIPTLTNLQNVTILDINFGSEQLRLSPDMKHITYIKLWYVTMTRKCLCGFLDSIPDAPHTVTGEVWFTTILPAEDQPQPSLSDSNDTISRLHMTRHSLAEARLVVEYIRQSTKFESNNDHFNKDEESDRYIWLNFKTKCQQ